MEKCFTARLIVDEHCLASHEDISFESLQTWLLSELKKCDHAIGYIIDTDTNQIVGRYKTAPQPWHDHRTPVLHQVTLNSIQEAALCSP